MKKALISVTIFNFIAAGITFLINVILARLFPYEVFGRINLLLSFVAITIVLLGYGFNNSLVVFYNKHKNSEVDKDLLGFITKKYFIFLTKALPAFLLALYLLNYFYDFNTYEILFFITASFFPALYRYLVTIFQALGKWSKYNFLNVSFTLLKGIVLILGGVLLYFLFNEKLDYTWYLVLYIIYTGFLFLLGILVTINYVSVKTTKKYDQKSFKTLILNLGMTNVIIALSMRLDNVIIEHTLGLKQVAIYSAANSLALVFPLITGSIMRVLLREISKDSKYYLNKILGFQKRFFPILVLVVLTVVFISPFLINLFFGERYDQSIPLFQILVLVYIGGVFFSPLESYFYNYNSSIILYVKITQFLIFLISSLILIRLLGLNGVAIAVVLSRIVAWLYFYFKSLKLSYAFENME